MLKKRLGQPAPKKLIPFEQTVLRFLQHHALVGRHVLVGTSGGLDSMALLHCLCRLRSVAKLSLSAVYVHHGKSRGKGALTQQRYRERANQCVQAFCEKHSIPFYTNAHRPSTVLRSENDLREYRYAVFREIQAACGAEVLCLAHHQDDLVETQLLRLIRGTGLQGLRGFAAYADGVARPFVGEFRKRSIVQYAKQMKVRSVDDPSNDVAIPLRNWLRQKWLRPLEKREAGLYASLARSLRQLAEASAPAEPAVSLIQDGRINYAGFMALTAEGKSALLAAYMRQQNIQGYSASHIREILKRLDSGQTKHNFRLLRRQWYINAEHIFCEQGIKHVILKE